MDDMKIQRITDFIGDIITDSFIKELVHSSYEMNEKQKAIYEDARCPLCESDNTEFLCEVSGIGGASECFDCGCRYGSLILGDGKPNKCVIVNKKGGGNMGNA